jgi:hypothetical protein
VAARRARDAADDETLAGAPFLAELTGGLDAVLEDAAAVRWPALPPAEVAALVRRLHAVQSRLDAVVLAGGAAVDDRDDVVGSVRAGTAGSRFLQHGVGMDPRAAHGDVRTARLPDPDTGDLPAVGRVRRA